MANKFADKSVKILLAEPSSATRQMMSEVLKANGFTVAQSMPSIKDTLQYLETDTVDWIICGLEATEENNALSLLKVCSELPMLTHISISIVVEEAEKDTLRKAFELGLLSYHIKPFTKDTLTTEINSFAERLTRYDSNLSLVAGSYLRQILTEKKDFLRRLEVEKELLRLFPASAAQLMNVAEPLFELQKKDQALSLLRQALMMDPLKEKALEEISMKYTNSKSLNGEGVAPDQIINTIGIENVMIVDPDDTSRAAVEQVFKEAGVKTVSSFADGESALAHLKDHPDPGLIIHEWRIPKVSGPVFLQRALSEHAANSIFVILSSLVQVSDMPLVREMGVANIIGKPFDKANFLRTVIWTIQQERVPSEFNAVERKVRNLLRGEKLNEAKPLVENYAKDERALPGRKKLLSAEIAYVEKNYTAARDLCVESIRLSGDSILSLNLLGRTLMQLRDFPNALKCLRKAQSMSPQNVERLCMIAEAQSELGDNAAATETVSQAQDIDPDLAKETAAKVAIGAGEAGRARAIMAQMESLETIISFMNTKAVAMSRSGEIEMGISEYKKTIASIPPDRKSIIDAVTYNLCLAYARSGDYEQSVENLQKLIETKPAAKLMSKANSLKSRLQQTIKTGEEFKFIGEEVQQQKSFLERAKDQSVPEEDLKLSENEIIAAQVLLQPGDKGLFLLYKDPASNTEAVSKMLAKPVHFNVRKAIEREETLKTAG